MSEEAKHAPKHAAGHGGGEGDHEEGHEGAPEWLISFADNTALMMGFFVILLGLNMGPKGTGAAQGSSQSGSQVSAAELDWAIGVRAGFNNPVRLDSTDPRDQPLIRRILERQAQGEGIEKGPKGQGQKLQSIRPSNYSALSGAVEFDENSSTISPQARRTLADIAEHIRGLRLVVQIRGHASAAEAFYQPDQAVRLSFERAMSVAQALVQMGLEWHQVRLVACGDNDRLKPVVYTNAEQKLNQRVEVIVTNKLATSAE